MLQNTFLWNAVTQYIHLGLALLAPEYNKTDILAAADMEKLNMDKNLIKYEKLNIEKTDIETYWYLYIQKNTDKNNFNNVNCPFKLLNLLKYRVLSYQNTAALFFISYDQFEHTFLFAYWFIHLLLVYYIHGVLPKTVSGSPFARVSTFWELPVSLEVIPMENIVKGTKYDVRNTSQFSWYCSDDYQYHCHNYQYLAKY